MITFIAFLIAAGLIVYGVKGVWAWKKPDGPKKLAYPGIAGILGVGMLIAIFLKWLMIVVCVVLAGVIVLGLFKHFQRPKRA